MRKGSLTPRAVHRLAVFDPPTVSAGLESFFEKVILTEELQVQLETPLQQEPQLGKKESNMFLSAMLITLSSDVPDLCLL